MMRTALREGRRIPIQCILRMTSVFQKKRQVLINAKHDMSGYKDDSETNANNKNNSRDFETYSKQRKYLGFGTRSAVSPIHRLNKILPDEYQVKQLDSSPTNQGKVDESSNYNGHENSKNLNVSEVDTNECRNEENDGVILHSVSEKTSVQSEQKNYTELRKRLKISKHLSPTERLKCQLPEHFYPENK
ncbi:hypothetical protein FSP39_002715 [Pinctada imbricata]|uniref:Uncharacterized protein n=1 Tax=Pinctada imbricata TaxID=66713 RepID=A0AA88Y248_PINIB|nr:hypothetical protein FSP39_002715 [Pinctada imbricata]